MTDPFDALASPPEPQTPRPRFARQLRARLVTELGLDADPALQPTVDLPERKPVMSTTTTAPATATPVATAVTPYLTASDAGSATPSSPSAPLASRSPTSTPRWT